MLQCTEIVISELKLVGFMSTKTSGYVLPSLSLLSSRSLYLPSISTLPPSLPHSLTHSLPPSLPHSLTHLHIYIIYSSVSMYIFMLTMLQQLFSMFIFTFSILSISIYTIYTHITIYMYMCVCVCVHKTFVNMYILSINV